MKVNWLTLFKDSIIVYTRRHTKQLNAFCGQNAELLIRKEAGGHKVTTVV
jgi:hypothetical protein